MSSSTEVPALVFSCFEKQRDESGHTKTRFYSWTCVHSPLRVLILSTYGLLDFSRNFFLCSASIIVNFLRVWQYSESFHWLHLSYFFFLLFCVNVTKRIYMKIEGSDHILFYAYAIWNGSNSVTGKTKHLL